MIVKQTLKNLGRQKGHIYVQILQKKTLIRSDFLIPIKNNKVWIQKKLWLLSVSPNSNDLISQLIVGFCWLYGFICLWVSRWTMTKWLVYFPLKGKWIFLDRRQVCWRSVNFRQAYDLRHFRVYMKKCKHKFGSSYSLQFSWKADLFDLHLSP